MPSPAVRRGTVINPDDYLERRLSKLMRNAPSVRAAGGVIVGITTLTVFLAGALMRTLNSDEFHSYGDALWWALQTVTTVGYGDIVPRDTIGRIIGAVVMLQGIAFLTVVTAVITSIFVDRARRERLGSAVPPADEFYELLRSFDERLQRIEQKLDSR